MIRFLLKKGVKFIEGSTEVTVLKGFPDGRVEFEYPNGEVFRIFQKEIWKNHQSRKWKLDPGSLLETNSETVLTMPRDAATYREKDRKDQERRFAYMNAIKIGGARRVKEVETIIARTGAQLKDPTPPTYRTYCRWNSESYKATGDPNKLFPKHELKGRHTILDGELLSLVEDVLDVQFMNMQRMDINTLYDRIIEAIESHNEKSAGDHLPRFSKATLYRYIKSLDRLARVRAREGRHVATCKWRPVLHTFRTVRINERWEVDHTPLNVQLVCDKTGEVILRPILSVVLDKHTRYIVGIHIGTRAPNQQSVGWTLSMAMLSKSALLEKYGLSEHEWHARGVPEAIVVDNALEFHGAGVREGCNAFGISLVYCPRRSPWFKGAVERFMRTLGDGLIHHIPGTTWATTEDRGDYPSEKMACFTLEGLYQLVIEWMVIFYHNNPHRGLRGKMTPNEAWIKASHESPVFMPADPDELEVAFTAIAHRLTTNRGVTFEHLSYNSNALQTIRTSLPKGQRVMFRYLHDRVDYIYVFDPFNKEYIRVNCIDPEYTENLTRWMHEEIIEMERRTDDKIALDGLRRQRLKLFDKIAAAEKSKNRKDRAWAQKVQNKSSKDTFVPKSENANTDEQTKPDIPNWSIDVPFYDSL